MNSTKPAIVWTRPKSVTMVNTVIGDILSSRAYHVSPTLGKNFYNLVHLMLLGRWSADAQTDDLYDLQETLAQMDFMVAPNYCITSEIIEGHIPSIKIVVTAKDERTLKDVVILQMVMDSLTTNVIKQKRVLER